MGLGVGTAIVAAGRVGVLLPTRAMLESGRRWAKQSSGTTNEAARQARRI